MISILCRVMFIVGAVAVVWMWNGNMNTTVNNELVTTAQAAVGRPASPVSYTGVARRSTVGAGAPGVGVTPGVGVGVPGPGAVPGNRGGPVNRVGVR